MEQKRVTELKKVTMNVTNQDIHNVEALAIRFGSRSKASAVSSALAIVEGLAQKISEGNELLIRDWNGNFRHVLIKGLNCG